MSLNGADFIAKGKEAGLNNQEIKMLKKAADILSLDKPLTLLGSVAHVDSAISEINSILKLAEYKDMEIIELLEELYTYRKNIELERRERRKSISTSKEIPISQKVKITVGNIEQPIVGIVSENTTNSLTIDLVKETSVKPGINWDGPINVYFWKKDDAGYFFQSIVGESPSNKKWKIAHSNSLIRSQKREDIRIDVEINTYIYKLDDISKKNPRKEGFSGTFGQLRNISEGGAAFLINGILENGSALKLEFEICNDVVVVCGVVKSSSYNKVNNISLVRFKIIEPAIQMLSIIRSFLYTSSKELYGSKEDNSVKDDKNVEKIEEINNNEHEEDVSEVETLSEDSSVLN